MRGELCLLLDGKIHDLSTRSRLKVGSERGDDVCIGDGASARIDVDADGRARIHGLGNDGQGMKIRGATRRDHQLTEGDVISLGRSRILVGRRFEGMGEATTALSWQGILGGAKPTLSMMELLAKAASSRAPVWIAGESGTGKELAARAIHESGARSGHSFIAVNCAALPDNLIESELFGVERGAYTGAMKTRAGAFAQANHGTLLLDEVGELPLTAQAKLLRVLESGEVQPVGSERTVKVDVRILCASWRDLEAEVDAGRFRHDLLHRLWVLRVDLPPLRERREDVALLVRAMLEREHSGHLFPGAGLLSALKAHDWPGNIRELRNCVTRAVAADDCAELMPRTKLRRSAKEVDTRVDEALLSTLARHRGNRLRTARALGVSRSTLYRWLASGRALPEVLAQANANIGKEINLAS